MTATYHSPLQVDLEVAVVVEGVALVAVIPTVMVHPCLVQPDDQPEDRSNSDGDT